MTNINEKAASDNMRLHIESAFQKIDKYLPERYVKKVLDKLPAGTSISPAAIRNVRLKNPRLRLENHINIINLLVQVADDNRRDMELLQSNHLT